MNHRRHWNAQDRSSPEGARSLSCAGISVQRTKMGRGVLLGEGWGVYLKVSPCSSKCLDYMLHRRIRTWTWRTVIGPLGTLIRLRFNIWIEIWCSLSIGSTSKKHLLQLSCLSQTIQRHSSSPLVAWQYIANQLQSPPYLCVYLRIPLTPTHLPDENFRIFFLSTLGLEVTW